ncbi:MAG: hypothetical protein HGA39_04425 [Coriobacteriia bacterium]|nr:hypothetical protein [Coriobacteriia bacterium]
MIAYCLAGILAFSLLSFVVIFHSPYTYLKDLWVTTAMSTMNHQYLARIFVSDKEIEEIMARNRVVDSGQSVDVSQISSPPVANNLAEARKLQEELALIEKIDLSGPGYHGTLLIVHDPSRVFVGATSKAGVVGEKLDVMAKKYDAVAAINAGGFVDVGGVGNGGTADGLTISQGKVVSGVNGVRYDLVGFTQDNKLMLGSYTLAEIKNMQIRDAVSFHPFLIVNGQPSQIIGNGGWGIDPRTAIGQRQDGAVLLLSIDGRQASAVGVSIKDLQNIMIQYGAYNATNLDGGSSTTIFWEGSIINNPCGPAGARYLPNAIMVSNVDENSLLSVQGE